MSALEKEWVAGWVVSSNPLLRTCLVLVGGLHSLAYRKPEAAVLARKETLSSWTHDYSHQCLPTFRGLGEVEEPVDKCS